MLRPASALLAASAAALAAAQGVRVDARAVGSALVVNELEVVKGIAKKGAKSPQARAAEMAASVLAWDGVAKPEAVGSGKSWKVVLGPRTVFTPTAADAAALKSTPDSLAKSSAARLARALALGKLRTNVQDTKVPPDRAVKFELVGSEARKASVGVWPKGIAKVVRRQGEFEVVPVSTGEATIVVKGMSAEQRATLKVLPYAPALPAQIAVRVTGSRRDVRSVAAAARAAVVRAAPGAVLAELGAELPAPLPGEATQGSMSFRVSAPEAFPRESVVRVTANNVLASLAPETALLYSNDPENLAGPGPLYDYRLAPSAPVRLLWHHKNTTWVPLVVEYLAVNDGLGEARLSLSMGEGEAHTNPTLAGYRAADQFLDLWLNGVSAEVPVPPGGVLPLVALRCASHETVSGLARIEVRGGSVRLVGRAVRADAWHPAWRSVGAGPLAWSRLPVLPASAVGEIEPAPHRHVYPRPFRDEQFRYELGGRFGFVRVGEKAIPDVEGGGVLHGNFGVIYRVQGQISNPTDQPAEAEVVLEASAGYAGALFELDGQIVRAGMLQSKQEFVLCNVKLPPRSERTLRFRTLPLSGANYPVTITVRPVGIER